MAFCGADDGVITLLGRPTRKVDDSAVTLPSTAVSEYDPESCGSILVNSAMPSESVIAVRVLVGDEIPGTGGVPELGPDCWTRVTVSPTAGSLLASSTVTAACVGVWALVSEGSFEKVIDAATPVVVEPAADDPHCQFTIVMPSPQYTVHSVWIGALLAGAGG